MVYELPNSRVILLNQVTILHSDCRCVLIMRSSALSSSGNPLSEHQLTRLIVLFIMYYTVYNVYYTVYNVYFGGFPQEIPKRFPRDSQEIPKRQNIPKIFPKGP